MQVLGQSISKNSLILGLFAILTVGVTAGTYELTKERIFEQERLARAKALFEIIPEQMRDNDLLNNTITLPNAAELGLDPTEKITGFVSQKEQVITGLALPTIAPDGYTGRIKLVVGIDASGALTGVRVLTHKETPGLGDKIDLKKSNWILSFNTKSFATLDEERWKVKKDGGEFDQFTGATITPRAVVKAVYKTISYFHKYKAQLLPSTKTSTLISTKELTKESATHLKNSAEGNK